MLWTVKSDDIKKRLDIFLLEKNNDKTRSHIKHWINDDLVKVNGKSVKAGYQLKENDEVFLGEVVEKTLNTEAQNIPIDIIYEDDDLAVVNKPQGMVVHPAIGNYDKTLVNALLFKMKNLSSINGVIRPGIVHRIDKDTSGLLLVAKNDKSHIELSRQISTKECKRIYWALVDGYVKTDGEIKTFLGRDPKNRLKMAVLNEGKEAHTIYHVIKNYDKYSLLEFELKTGRTHQIRVHSTYIGHPIVGDKLYNYNKCKFKLDGQLLHAKKIIFKHPKTKEDMEFECDLPRYFKDVLKFLDLQIKED